METHGLNFREIHMDVKMKEKLQALRAKIQFDLEPNKNLRGSGPTPERFFSLAPNSTLE